MQRAPLGAYALLYLAVSLAPSSSADALAPQTPQGIFHSAQALIDAQLAVPELRARIDAAEAALARGDADTAHRMFSGIVATYGEVPVAELGEVRALFAAGRYREAIAMGNLVVGENPGYADALALLAYIQDRAGYTPQSLAALASARARQPDEPILLAAIAEILLDRGRVAEAVQALDTWMAVHTATRDVLLLRARAEHLLGNDDGESTWRARAAHAPRTARDGRWRLRHERAPTPAIAAPAITAWSVLANGVLIDAGRRVITRAHGLPTATLDGGEHAASGTAIHVRQAGGPLRTAVVERIDSVTGLAVLRLHEPAEAQESLSVDDLVDAPVAGPCIALAFPTAGSDDVVYPRMTAGFVANARLGTTPMLAITTPLAAQEGGALLLDATGRWIGITIGADDPIDAASSRASQFGNGPLAVRSDALLRAQLMPATDGNATPATQHPSSTDAIYERVAPALVQVLVPAQPAH